MRQPRLRPSARGLKSREQEKLKPPGQRPKKKGGPPRLAGDKRNRPPVKLPMLKPLKKLEEKLRLKLKRPRPAGKRRKRELRLLAWKLSERRPKRKPPERQQKRPREKQMLRRQLRLLARLKKQE